MPRTRDAPVSGRGVVDNGNLIAHMCCARPLESRLNVAIYRPEECKSTEPTNHFDHTTREKLNVELTHCVESAVEGFLVRS